MYVRASIGTLAALGLVDVKMRDKPLVAYLLQYSPSGCRAGCAFCLQSRKLFELRKGEYLGRIPWPVVDLELLEKSWRKVFNRICFQTVIKPGFEREALEVMRKIRSFEGSLPLSVAITPVPTSYLRELRSLGVDALGIGFDTATEYLFEKWGKPYSWQIYWKFIEKAIEVFGRNNVYVHLIVGLGETLAEMVRTIKNIYGLGARVALFNYVDEKGVSQISITYYRLVQLARYMVENGLNPDEYIDYEKQVLVREPELDILQAFYTSGCPSCNRPFYNEKPSGPLYNIPSERALSTYVNSLRKELAEIGVNL